MNTNQRTHGEYVPGRGFYDASLNGWVRDPAKLTQTVGEKYEPSEAERQAYRDNQDRIRRERLFKVDAEMEGLIRLRDSDKQEERETFQKLVAGARRMSLGDYESRRDAAISRGDFKPA